MDNEMLLTLMKERGYNTAKVAELTGLSVSTVNKIMYGVTTNPTVENLRKITSLLGCKIDDLLEEPQTIAAHHDGDDWTDEELREIEEFKSYVRSKREHDVHDI